MNTNIPSGQESPPSSEQLSPNEQADDLLEQAQEEIIETTDNLRESNEKESLKIFNQLNHIRNFLQTLNNSINESQLNTKVLAMINSINQFQSKLSSAMLSGELPQKKRELLAEMSVLRDGVKNILKEISSINYDWERLSYELRHVQGAPTEKTQQAVARGDAETKMTDELTVDEETTREQRLQDLTEGDPNEVFVSQADKILGKETKLDLNEPDESSEEEGTYDYNEEVYLASSGDNEGEVRADSLSQSQTSETRGAISIPILNTRRTEQPANQDPETLTNIRKNNEELTKKTEYFVRLLNSNELPANAQKLFKEINKIIKDKLGPITKVSKHTDGINLTFDFSDGSRKLISPQLLENLRFRSYSRFNEDIASIPNELTEKDAERARRIFQNPRDGEIIV